MLPVMTEQPSNTIIALAADADGKPPEWVELLPRGPRLVARDGREWTLNPDVVLAAFAANRAPLAIDYEHAQDHLAPKGQMAIAAGWINKLENRSGSVWGQVEWTAAAAQQIASKEYRFLSPSMRHTRDGVITRLAGAALVNRPALEMTALCQLEDLSTQETTMDFKKVAAALGLADSADEKAILAAIGELDGERSALCSELAIDVASKPEAVTAAVKKLKSDTETALAAVKDAGDVGELRTSLAALQEERKTDKINAALDAAQGEGKITPASRPEYLALCQAEGGLDRFTALAKTLPVIAAPSKLGDRLADTSDVSEEDPVSLAARANKYQDEQSALGRTVSLGDAIRHVKEAK